MIHQWWQRVGRRFRRKNINNSVAVQEQTPVNEDFNAVVPLRTNSDNAVVRKKDNLEIFNEAISKLVDRLEEINAGISLRVQQNEQLLDKMNQLPDYLSGLPQYAQKQSEILQELVAEMKVKSAGEQKMLDAVMEMTEQASSQTHKLGSIHEQLQTTAKTERQMYESIGRVGDSLNRLNDQTTAQSEWIGHLSRTLAATDQYVKLTLARQQNRFMWVFAISMAVTVMALAGLVIALFLINR